MTAHIQPSLSRELSLVFGAMEDGVFVTAPTGRILYANAHALSLVGADSVEGMTSEDLERRVELLEPEKRTPFPLERLPSRVAREGRAPAPVEVIWRRRDTGQEIQLAVTATPITAEDGTLLRVVTFLRDVTAFRHCVRSMRFLAEASGKLAASLEYGTTLQALASLAVPALADWCSVEILEPDGAVMQRAVAHVDPEKIALTNEIRRRNPLRIDSQSPPAHVLRTGRPALFPDFPVERLRAATRNPEDYRLLLSCAFKSAINVPLIARGRTLGLLCLYTAESGRRFNEDDLAVAVELGNRAALALDNARLFEDARAALVRKEEEARLNDTLRRLGNAFASELDFERLAQHITEEASFLMGARSGAFLYCDSDGTARQLAWGEPDESFQILARAWAPPLFAGGAPQDRAVRLDDLGQHPQVRALLPAGVEAAVRSLLAVPVASRAGRPLGQLVFGHVQPGAFTADHEHAALGVAVQAAIALDNARLFQQLREAEEQIRASEERLRMAVAAGRLGYYVLDVSTDRLELSPRLEAMLGLAPGTFDGNPDSLSHIIHPDDLRESREKHRALLEGQTESDAMVFRARHPDGSDRWIEHYNKVARDAEGRPVRVLGICMDVTERREAEEKVRRLVVELQRSNTELERFAYVASHDLQEPLRTVTSYTQLLSRRYKGKLDSDADEFMHFIVDAVTRMKRLINDLLTYSRVGTQAKPLVPVPFAEVLGRALDSLRATADEARAEISVAPELPVVLADEVQLEQLVQNLLGNALKFRGEVPPRVEVGVEPRDAEWVFYVRDNGIGIEPQFFERIFILFQRLHERDAYPGTGIGLALCKRIVERHGGRIWVESSPGKGATFYFTLKVVAPVRRAATG